MNKITPTIVLMYYDYPQVFVGTNTVDQNYCCMVVAEEDAGPTYLCTPISNLRKTELTSGKVDLLSIFANPEVGEFWLCGKDNSEIEFAMVERLGSSECPAKYLPKGGLLFSGYDEVAAKAEELNATVSFASLSVPESEKQARIVSSTLASFLIQYQNVVKLISKKVAKEVKARKSKDGSLYNLDVFGFSHGSFTVQMRSSNDGDLFADNHVLSIALDRLGEFLNSTENPDAAVAYLRTVKGHTAAALIRLLQFVDEHQAPLKVQWSTPRLGTSRVGKTNSAGVKSIIELCRQYEDLAEEVVVLTGVVEAASNERNTWKLIAQEDGEQYSGDVVEGSDISMRGIVIRDQVYKFHCRERIEFNVGTGKETTKLSAFLVEKA